MNRQFYINIILLLCINVLIKPLYIVGIDAQIQNNVGNQAYGLYFAIFNFLFLFQWILDPGIQNYNSQFIAKHRSALEEVFPNTAATKLLASMLFILIGGSLATLFYGQAMWFVIGLVCLSMTLMSVNLFIRSHFSAMGDFLLDTMLSFLDKFLLIIVLGYILYGSTIDITIPLFLKVQACVVGVVTIIMSIAFVVKYQITTIAFNIAKSKTLLKQSFPFALVFILMALFHKVDAIMLEQLLDDNAESAGIYAAGYRIFDGLNIIGYLFASLLLPMFANLIQQHTSLDSLFQDGIKILLVISGLVCVSFYIYDSDIMSFLYTESNPLYDQVLDWLLLSFFCFSMTYILGAMITASSRLKHLNMLFGLAIVINWGLNSYFIPLHQASGAALATCITQIVVLVGQLVLCYRMFALSIDKLAILKYSSFVGLAFVLFSVLRDYSTIHFLIKIIIGSIISVAYILSLKFLRLGSILNSNK